MRIAISCHPTQGGSGIVATELALALAARGHEIHMISCDRPFRLTEESGIRYHPVFIPDYPLFKYPPHDLSLVNKLVEVVDRHSIDVIHAHYAVPHAICAILAKHVAQPSPVKVVATMHGTDMTLVGSHPDFYRVCRHAMTQCDGLTVVSRWLQDRSRAEFSLDREPEVIHNFVDTRRFTPENHIKYPGKNEEFRILHASNFRPVKRVTDIVRIFHEIQKELPARLVLVGTGPELGLARELCSQLGICSQVEFSGAVMDIESMFRRSHLFMLMSDYESFGLSALEALACGTPVLASNTGGLPEVIDDGVNGYLSGPGRIKDAADKVISLLKNRHEWETMSQVAAEQARTRFSIDTIVPQYEQIYHRITTGG